MNELRIESIAEPIADSPEAVRWAIKSVFRADLMDLLPEDAEETRVIVLDTAFLREFVEVVGDAGIGQTLFLDVQSALDEKASSPRIGKALQSLWQALDESPYPRGEWGGVRERLGDELLANLLGISTSSLRRYANGARETPDEVAWRLHMLTRIIAALSGSYNDYGIRRWFERSRPQLDGRTPAELFRKAETEDDEGLTAVVNLAEALAGPALAA
jgi:hypothetical protein